MNQKLTVFLTIVPIDKFWPWLAGSFASGNSGASAKKLTAFVFTMVTVYQQLFVPSPAEWMMWFNGGVISTMLGMSVGENIQMTKISKTPTTVTVVDKKTEQG